MQSGSGAVDWNGPGGLTLSARPIRTDTFGGFICSYGHGVLSNAINIDDRDIEIIFDFMILFVGGDVLGNRSKFYVELHTPTRWWKTKVNTTGIMYCGAFEGFGSDRVVGNPPITPERHRLVMQYYPTSRNADIQYDGTRYPTVIAIGAVHAGESFIKVGVYGEGVDPNNCTPAQVIIAPLSLTITYLP